MNQINRRGFTNIILLTALIVVVSSLGAYYVLNLQAQQPSIPIPTTQSVSAVTVDFSTDEGPVTYRASGSFEIGKTPLELVEPLKFRLITWATKLRDYELAQKLGAEFQLKLGGGQTYLTSKEPWPGDNDNWTKWEHSVRKKVEEVSAAKADVQYDIWNEPDSEWPKHVRCSESELINNNPQCYAQYLEMWRRTVLLIRELQPDAVIVGPSSGYFPFVREVFLPYATKNNVLPDVLSWHSYDPENKESLKGSGLTAEVTEARKYFTDRHLKVPKVSINEYLDYVDMVNAGVFVKHFYELERAKVDSAAKGGWFETKTGWVSYLNNLVTSGLVDGEDRLEIVKPRSLWWALKGYADITGRLVRFVPYNNVYGVVGYDQNTNEARVVLGKISGEKQETVIEFKDLSRTSLAKGKAIWVEAYHVPASDREQATPIKVISKAYPVDNGNLKVTLPGFGAADVYTIVLRPAWSSTR